MENWRENFSAISKLKVAATETDALAVRLFFERLLTAADFHPPGISPKAIVCIRKINAPPVKNSRFANSAYQWEKGVRDEVEKLFRGAFRPFRKAVPAQAESVVFEDQAEMLACLARDWCGDSLVEHWWWRAIYPNLFRAQTVAQVWLDAAELVPFALQILSKMTAAKVFVKKLQPAETIELLRRIVRLFGLNKLEAAVFQKEESDFERRVKPAEKAAFQTKSNLTASETLDSVFINQLTEINSDDLSFEQKCLFETALLLARSPRIARSAEFAERIKIYRLKTDFRKTVSGGKFAEFFEIKKPSEKTVKAREKPARRLPETKLLSTNPPKPARSETPAFIARKADEKKIEKRRGELKSKFELPEKAEEAKSRGKIRFETFQSDNRIEKFEHNVKEKREKFTKPAAEKTSFENFFEDFEPANDYSFQTRFGGVLYLLNLALYLGLYRDFTESLTMEIDLSIWDFVALLGLEFLGEQIKTDAVWDFLKLAAEREHDREFGQEFNQNRDWHVPPEWLETFPKNQKWFWTIKNKRLVIRDPEGFNVVDVSRRGVLEIQLKKEAEIYKKYFSEIAKAGKRKTAEIKSKKWLINLAEYLQKRLFQALDLQTAEELNAILFIQKAVVAVSATRLEVTFALADLPIELRLAGIDRNPGWIPAVGKFVYFYFV